MSSSVVLLALCELFFFWRMLSQLERSFIPLCLEISRSDMRHPRLLVFHCGLMCGRMLLYVLDGSDCPPNLVTFVTIYGYIPVTSGIWSKISVTEDASRSYESTVSCAERFYSFLKLFGLFITAIRFGNQCIPRDKILLRHEASSPKIFGMPLPHDVTEHRLSHICNR